MKLGTPGRADWGTYKPDPDGLCHDCGRDFGGHAGRGCFAPNASGLAPPRSTRDTCPACGGVRRQLIVARGRFYCAACGVAGEGPIENVAGAQLVLGVDA